MEVTIENDRGILAIGEPVDFVEGGQISVETTYDIERIGGEFGCSIERGGGITVVGGTHAARPARFGRWPPPQGPPQT